MSSSRSDIKSSLRSISSVLYAVGIERNSSEVHEVSVVIVVVTCCVKKK